MSQRTFIKGLMISASVSILLVGFQNCSNQVSLQDVSAEALKQAANDQGSNDSSSTDDPALDSDQLPDNSSTIVDQPVKAPPVASQPPKELPPSQQPAPVVPPAEPPLTQEDKDCINWALADEPEAAASCLRPKSSSRDEEKAKDVVKPKTPSDKCYVKPGEDKDDTDYESLCRLNKKQVKLLNTVSNTLKLFKLRGLTVLTPESLGSSSIASLEDVRGTTVLCGLTVDKINNSRGQLVALDSSIKSFSNHRGKAVFINTASESCTDIKGKFVLLGAKSACKNIEGSKGLVQIDRGSH